MELVRTIDATRLTREKSKEAIRHALDGRWREAVSVNEEILYYFPENTEALNRLGKAYLEVGVYDQARKSFQKVMDLAPHNSIAKKNLSRLSHLPCEGAAASQGRRVAPRLFLEESGKTGITELRVMATEETLAKAAGGDGAQLEVHNHTLVVKSQAGELLGYVEPRLGSRLARLTTQGNRYEAAILHCADGRISVIIRETFRNPRLRGLPSFNAAGMDDYRGQIRDDLLSFDLELELDDDGRDDPTAMWTEDGEEITAPSGRELVRAMASVDDNGDEG